VRRVGLFALALGLSLLGCGYQWVRYGGSLGEVKRVAIETLDNESYEPGVEAVVTDALMREFLRRGGVELVDDPRSADLVLSGSVLPLETRRLSFSSVILVLEYEVVLRLDLQARLRDERSVAMDPLALDDSELYLASADVEATRKNREEAIRRLAGVLAGRVHDTLAERLSP
jgi:hypothetical protein